MLNESIHDISNNFRIYICRTVVSFFGLPTVFSITLRPGSKILLPGQLQLRAIQEWSLQILQKEN